MLRGRLYEGGINLDISATSTAHHVTDMHQQSPVVDKPSPDFACPEPPPDSAGGDSTLLCRLRGGDVFVFRCGGHGRPYRFKLMDVRKWDTIAHLGNITLTCKRKKFRESGLDREQSMVLSGNHGKDKEYSEQYEEELQNRRLRGIKDYIEKQIALSVPECLEIDTVVLLDGTSIPGRSIRYCFEEMLLAVGDSGEMVYVPYTAISRVVSTDKT